MGAVAWAVSATTTACGPGHGAARPTATISGRTQTSRTLWTSGPQSASQNLRLVDFDVYTVNGQQLWAGVWREGSDGYYLWVDADWAHFTAKWAQLASQNLRLVAVRSYNDLWAGAWRSGIDAYYLWANVSQGDFLAMWSQLQGQNLRLIDLEVTAVAGAGGSTGGVTGTATGATAATGAVFSSEMSGREAMTRLGPGSIAAAGATGHGGGAGPGGAETATPGTGGGAESVARLAAAVRADQGLAAGNLGFGGGSHAGETMALTAAPSGEAARPPRPGQGGGS